MDAKIVSLWHDFVDILFPNLCAACEKPLSATEYQVCTGCLLAIPRVSDEGLAMAQMQNKFAAYPEVKSAYSFVEYHPKGKVQALLRSLKYRGNYDLGVFLGRWLGAERRRDAPRGDLLVPVPLHRKKEKQRGYNQSTAFAHGLSEAWQIPVDESLLQRDVYGLSQTGKTKAARIAAMAGSFSMRVGATPRQLRVVLIDDVLTTGATLEACIQTLVTAGCKEIHIITIAVAQA